MFLSAFCRTWKILLVLVFALCLAGNSQVFAVEPAHSYIFCGAPLDSNAFGRPLDYNDPAEAFNIHANVEGHHFNRNVEALIKGQTGILPLDIAYVLSQIPNHHRALAAIGRWERQNGYRPDLEERKVYSADCFFRRALIFTPTDPVVHMIYGIHLYDIGEMQGALREFLIAKSYDPNYAELNYNLGLLYVDLGDYEAARKAALVAYSGGFPLSGLKSKLQKLGEWNDEQSN